MSSIILNNEMRTLSVGRVIDAYTGVTIYVGKDDSGNDISYSAGDNSGYVLEINNPFGTQTMADSILSSLKLRNIQYKPYQADNAIVDPAVEIGDSITVNGTDSIVFSVAAAHSRLMDANVAAPYDEEIDHEFSFVPRSVREFRRESAETRARFAITESEISAKVSKTGGEASSFGWTLTDSDWSLYSNNNRVLHATSTGIEVTGKITATSGQIGDCVIENGVLKVNSANIRSINADIITAGTLSVNRIENRSLTGTKIAYNTITGGGSGSGNLGLSTISTSNTENGINTNLGYAAGYGAACVYGAAGPDNFSAYNIRARGSLSQAGYGFVMGTPFTVNGITHYPWEYQA